MNTKYIMTLSAIVLGASGIILTFLPDDILIFFNSENNKLLQILLQISGALYFSFAMLNWMTKTSIIGGIYNKPIAVANFTHFLIAGLALIKGVISNPSLGYVIWVIAFIYSIFAIVFGLMAFRPAQK